MKKGEDSGKSCWKAEGRKKVEGPRWKLAKLHDERKTQPSDQQKRDAKFRPLIISFDKRCVITGEKTRKALDAAHIRPAAEDGNEIPENGIALRADIHRLYDEGYFLIDPKSGETSLVRGKTPELSETYRNILENGKLPRDTLERVRVALRERWRG